MKVEDRDASTLPETQISEEIKLDIKEEASAVDETMESNESEVV